MLFLILITGHLLADFVFQTRCLAKKKEESVKYSLVHSGIHLLTYASLILGYAAYYNDADLISLNYILIITIISVLHFITDAYLKKMLVKCFKDNDFIVFVFDQAIHLLLIIVASLIVDKEIEVIINQIKSLDGYLLYTFIIVINFILLTFFASTFIEKLLATLSKNNKEEESLDDVANFGKWIGYTERIMVFLLLVLGSYQGIVFVVGLKTFARFKQLNEKSFVERYILGTLLSITMAVLIGFIYIRFTA